MNSKLDVLRTQLDITGDPRICIQIADFLEEAGDVGTGWRWLGEQHKTPHEFGGMFHWWQEDCFEAGAGDELGIGKEQQLPLREMGVRSEVPADVPFFRWQEDCFEARTGDEWEIGEEQRLPLREMGLRSEAPVDAPFLPSTIESWLTTIGSDSRIGTFTMAEQWVRNALANGLLK